MLTQHFLNALIRNSDHVLRLTPRRAVETPPRPPAKRVDSVGLACAPSRELGRSFRATFALSFTVGICRETSDAEPPL